MKASFPWPALISKTRLIRRLCRLQSWGTIAIAFFLYTCIAFVLFQPSTVTVLEEEGSCSFLSTDLGDPVRPSIEQAILQAKQSILLIIYSLSDRKIIGALRNAANRGVEVTVLHDPIETPDCQSLLGKKITCYPKRGRGLMHNKLLVIDHTQVWLGSANMSTRSLTEQGNLVVAMRSRVLSESIEQLAQTILCKDVCKKSPAPEPVSVRFVDSKISLFFHPYHGRTTLDTVIKRINKASHRVFVAMFTFTHPDLIDALCRAKERGVNVRVVLDQESALQTSRKAYVRFKREGVPCGYRTKTGLLHYKTAVIDDLLIAGSCNWTKAGFLFNHEAMLFIDPLTSSQQKWVDQWWKEVERASSL